MPYLCSQESTQDALRYNLQCRLAVFWQSSEPKSHSVTKHIKKETCRIK